MAAHKGNRYALNNTGGQPPKYSCAENFAEKCGEYFEPYAEVDKDGNKINQGRPTVTGLALFLGFCSRQSMYDYNEKEKFSYIVKRALTVIEMHYEENLNSKACTGAIFALKNMGWKDQTQTDITTGGESINEITEIQIHRIDANKDSE